MKYILLLSTFALATMCKPACLENAHPAFLKEMTNRQKIDAAAVAVRGSQQIIEPLFPDVLPAVIHQLIKQYWTDPLEYIQAAYTKEIIDRHQHRTVLKITPDNIWVTHANNQLQVWKGANCIMTYQTNPHNIDIVDVTSESSLITTSFREQTTRVWQNGEEKKQLVQGHNSCVAISSSGIMITANNAVNEATIWSADGTIRHILKHPRTIRAIAIIIHHPKTIFAIASGNEIILWHEDGIKLECLTGHTKSIHCIIAQGTALATASYNDGTVRLWQINENNRLKGHPLVLRTHAASHIALAKDKTLATCDNMSDKIQIWRNGKLINTMLAPQITGADGTHYERNIATGMMDALTFTDDGQLIVASHATRTAHAWKPDPRIIPTLHQLTCETLVRLKKLIEELSKQQERAPITQLTAEQQAFLQQLPEPMQNNIYKEFKCKPIAQAQSTDASAMVMEQDLNKVSKKRKDIS